ncbi:MAG TPA: HAMP domain-containing sensor histidine kinase [Noviherbaspirillum sp.]|uniref:sensor histidine kinase n=1 Tax=Noviherbaspirillum sp. TaxID=1926288 RepID=UPI002D430F7E|nr:HAMP domain-containing sensor histidine kinase [Noviherbaspirillum sp.]HYD97275.1 HAMP domain-containing sensor histidine kinase [Noviherbaspirillum sp.]
MNVKNDNIEIDPFSVCLRDPELERTYREAHFERDRRRLRNLVWTLALIGGVSGLVDWYQHLHGSPGLAQILPLRLAIFVGSAAIGFWVGTIRSYRKIEPVTMAYGVFTMIVNIPLVATHPALYLIGPATMLGTVVIIYLYLPVRFLAIVAIALGNTITMWFAWAVLRDPAPEANFVSKAALWLLAINILSFINTRALFRSERQLFAHGIRLERALRQEREVLDQQRHFISMISHEFRNPLAIIKSQAQLAMDEAADSGTVHTQRYSAIGRAATRLEVLFQQWLDGDRAVANGLEPVFDPVRVGDWIPRVAAQYGAQPARLVQLPVAGCTANAMIRADEAMISVALVNLIDNAHKYSPADSIVTLSVELDGNEVCVRVADRGSGIAPEDAARIFEKYVRVHHDRGTMGLGIGLFLVRQIAEKHGGKVVLDSRPGNGSTFTLRLPLAGTGMLAPAAG